MGIHQITKHEWPKLTEAQIQGLCAAIGPPEGHPADARFDITVWDPDDNRVLLANQIASAFKCAKWEKVNVQTPIDLEKPDGMPSGIEFVVEQETPTADRVGNALVALFGENTVIHAHPARKDAPLGIEIWYKP